MPAYKFFIPINISPTSPVGYSTLSQHCEIFFLSSLYIKLLSRTDTNSAFKKYSLSVFDYFSYINKTSRDLFSPSSLKVSKRDWNSKLIRKKKSDSWTVRCDITGDPMNF